MPGKVFLKMLVISLALTSAGCVSAYTKSVGGETARTFSRIYLTDYNTAWQASLDALKTSHLDVSNREGGFVQTKWTDNTAERNFTDSFGAADSYLKAQYRVRLTLTKNAVYNGKLAAVKIIVQKDQMIQRDVLEGWRPMETDGIDENTLLYRIGRIMIIKMKIAKMDDEKSRREMQNTPLGN